MKKLTSWGSESIREVSLSEVKGSGFCVSRLRRSWFSRRPRSWLSMMNIVSDTCFETG